MAHTIDLPASAMVALTRDALTTLRNALFRDMGANAAAPLQEAGYAGGAATFAAFERWLADNGHGAAESLPADEFGQMATEFFRDAGWGSLSLGALDAVATVDSSDWAEADPASAMEFPGCHVTTGMFSDFFGRLAGSPVAVMEVECRSMGSSRCRFLVGSTEVLQHVYDAMAAGEDYARAASAGA